MHLILVLQTGMLNEKDKCMHAWINAFILAIIIILRPVNDTQ